MYQSETLKLKTFVSKTSHTALQDNIFKKKKKIIGKFSKKIS